MSSSEKTYLAIDLGAESGRAVIGRVRDDRVEIEEAHRFENVSVMLRGRLYWDFPRLFAGVVEGIRRAAALSDSQIDGISVDSWGVDFGLLDRSGQLLQNPVHYRDARHLGTLPRVTERISNDELWNRTGVQSLEINTLFQLFAMQEESPELLGAADRFLLMADLVAYFLGGRPVAERTLASTSQMLRAAAGDGNSQEWDLELADTLGLDRAIFPEVVEPGTITGELLPEITRDCGLATAPPIIAAASHDTAAAVASVPAAADGSWAFLSSGTWSLLGLELASSHRSPDARDHQFTNEAGVARRTRFLRLITGLWIVQECRRTWAKEGVDLDYAELTRLAASAAPAEARIDPDDPRFAQPGDMPSRIAEVVREQGKSPPSEHGAVVRLVLESLAHRYGEVVRDAAKITETELERVHVVGGGSQNRLLNQLTADALGKPVLAGPVEATATGNVLLQHLATGGVRDLDELRQIVARSVELQTFEPERGD